MAPEVCFPDLANRRYNRAITFLILDQWFANVGKHVRILVKIQISGSKSRDSD